MGMMAVHAFREILCIQRELSNIIAFEQARIADLLKIIEEEGYFIDYDMYGVEMLCEHIPTEFDTEATLNEKRNHKSMARPIDAPVTLTIPQEEAFPEQAAWHNEKAA